MNPLSPLCILLPLILCFIGYVTYLDFNPKPIKVPLPKFEGPLAYNELLDSAEKLFEGKIKGPESLAVLNGDIYTGINTGEIVRVSADKTMSTVARIGKECEGYWESRICGRPLGIRASKDGKLYVVDAVYGLHSVDVKTGLVIPLLTTYRKVEGRYIIFPDDVAIDNDGIIYLTDVSSRWDLDHALHCAGEFDNTGRVIRFDPKTNEATVIMKDLYFPNGIQISPKGDVLLVAEVTKRRILRYYLTGKLKGTSDVFVDQLPGEPDNIRLSSKGGYWVALATARNSTHTLITDFMTDHPLILKYTTMLLYTVGSVMEQVTKLLPCPPCRERAFLSHHWQGKLFRVIIGKEKQRLGCWHLVKYGRIGTKLFPPPTMIIELSSDGKILRSLYSVGNFGSPSEVLEHNGYLYIGSYINNYLGKLKL